EDQVVRWNKPQRGLDTDLDSNDHNPAIKDASKAGRAQMAFVEFGVVHPNQPFRQNRPSTLAQQTLFRA
ncbi:MAG: hypothetical protein ACK505_09865, partial [Flavobacteriales bacterium]